MIENYVSKTVKCSCGRTHASNVEKIVIKNGVIENGLIDFLRDNSYNKVTVVCDKNGYRVAGERVVNALSENGFIVKVHVFNDERLVPDERAVGSLIMDSSPDCNLFLAVGSGTVNDLTRYVSAVKGLPFATFGIAPSMDGYISAGSALIYNGFKLTFQTHAPKAVFFEPKILADAPREMIGAGVGDLLGKINCLTDWKLSEIITGEWRCEFISGIVEKAIEKTFASKDGIIAKKDDAVATLLEALLLSGVCMDYAGNSRPASGCEHHMSHFSEMRFLSEGRPTVLHGIEVGVFTVIALKAYRYVAKLEPDFMAIGYMKRMSYREWKKAVEKSFGRAAGEIIEVEKESGKNDINKVNARLAVIEKKWDEIKTLAKNAGSADEVAEFLGGIGAPVSPEQIGLDRGTVKESIIYAKELRNRYTVLQLLYDLGELENFADTVIEEYYGR
ncbi:MAG: sn-glycerol-1-phosphate dehydrogenase [Clostridia bacterium]|nr:sn-glycerol-1-phosphate dehydrogenase [Clostridia bacterium]